MSCVVSVACLERRLASRELALGPLRPLAEVVATEDPGIGPAWKYLQPLPTADIMVVADDDMAYEPWRFRLVTDAVQPGVIVQGSWAFFLVTQERKVITGKTADRLGRTHIVRSGMLTAFNGKDFERVVQVLRDEEPGWSPTERIADDYVVSRAAYRLGFQIMTIPCAGPRWLPTAKDEGALHCQPPGNQARYQELAAHDTPWWPSW